jgi:Fic family protein
MYVERPPLLSDVVAVGNTADLQRILSADLPDSEYLHWDELRHRDAPGDLSHRDWWFGLKIRRRMESFPLVGQDGHLAAFSTPDRMLALLHFIDQRCSGEIAIDEAVIKDEQVRHRYLVNSLMEEAIRSSQLEGATTSRRAAKQLLQSGREPKNRSERMILNNYRAMMYIRTELGDELTPEKVLALHRVVTDGTLNDPDAAGRLQRPQDERVGVYSRDDGKLLHRPPPAEELPARLAAMCSFANGGDDDKRFIHPVVRAVLLHYWLGYDHPFEDGNGRTARALFYWSMRRNGYWLVEFLSISRILREAPAQYARAYLYSETDENDATYFLLYQLRVIKRAVEELHRYLQRKVAEVREVETLLRADDGLNHRQLALLGHALRNSDEVYTFAGHAQAHGVTHETARTDLAALEARHLLERRNTSRPRQFVSPTDLAHRLRHPTVVEASPEPTHA